MNLVPSREIKQAAKLMDDFFNGGLSIWPKIKSTVDTVNAIELSEDKDNVYVSVEMPGIPEDKIQIEISNNMLTVSGEREEIKEGTDKNCKYSEFTYGKLSRSISVGNIDIENSKAEYKNGIIQITLPKNEKEKTRKLKIGITPKP